LGANHFGGNPENQSEVSVNKQTEKERKYMLWTICLILIVLWLLGLVTSTTMGGLIHILLVVAIIMLLVSFISGRKARL
jgi:hypothetical protein